MVLILLYIVHVIVSLFLIAVVLLQQGKGADLSVFGGGGTMTAFGARGAATLLHKLTVTSFILFIVTTMSIGAYQRSLTSGSVVDDVPASEGAPVATGVDADVPATPTELEAADDAAGEAEADPVVDDPIDEESPLEDAPDEGGG